MSSRIPFCFPRGETVKGTVPFRPASIQASSPIFASDRICAPCLPRPGRRKVQKIKAKYHANNPRRQTAEKASACFDSHSLKHTLLIYFTLPQFFPSGKSKFVHKRNSAIFNRRRAKRLCILHIAFCPNLRFECYRGLSNPVWTAGTPLGRAVPDGWACRIPKKFDRGDWST